MQGLGQKQFLLRLYCDCLAYLLGHLKDETEFQILVSRVTKFNGAFEICCNVLDPFCPYYIC